MTTSSTMPAGFVTQYDHGLRALAAQRTSRFSPYVDDQGTITGAVFTGNLIDTRGTTPQSRVRLGPTILAQLDQSVRQAAMVDFFDALAIDRFDLPKLLANPTYKYQEALTQRWNRAKDARIFTAILGPVQLGPDADGNPQGLVSLPASQIILDGGTGMTLAKLVHAKALFRKNEFDEQAAETHQLCIAYNSDMLEAVLNDPLITRGEYMTGVTLRDAVMPMRWLGFTWIPYEALPVISTGANTVKATAVWAKDAIRTGTGFTEGTVVQRPDLQNAWQATLATSYAAMRMEEAGVVQINFIGNN